MSFPLRCWTRLTSFPLRCSTRLTSAWQFMAHLPDIPSQVDVEVTLVERKEEHLEAFLGDED